MIIARKVTGDIWELEDMLKHFKEELQTKERCAAVTIKSHAATREPQEPSTTSTFNIQNKIHCVYWIQSQVLHFR